MSVLEILIFADVVSSQLGIRLPTNLLFQFLFEYWHVQYTDFELIQSSEKQRKQNKPTTKQPTKKKPQNNG